MFLGIDIGTSGCRAFVIDQQGTVQARCFVSFPTPQRRDKAIDQDPAIWWNGVLALFQQLAQQTSLTQIQAVCLDGTSGTVIAADKHGEPLYPGIMYNDGRAIDQAQRIAQFAPRESAAHGVSSTLSKALWLLDHLADKPIAYLLNQCDWVVGKLCGEFGLSDHNNCIKLGFDAMQHCWPAWLDQLGLPRQLLPRVYKPGELLTHISDDAAKLTGLSAGIPIYAGTTDSTAAIYATGAMQPGDAITSLGSTLVTKVISETPIFLPSEGVYSQPFGKFWLAGGGSNSGGAVLLHFFTPQQMREMSAKIDPATPSALDYYPLHSPGERFPISDPQLAPRLTPRPADDVAFFHGLLEGITRIEKQAYQLLAQLGAPYPTRIYSAGGGAHNAVWTAIRARILDAKIVLPEQQEAAYGVAKIARDGYKNYSGKSHGL